MRGNELALGPCEWKWKDFPFHPWTLDSRPGALIQFDRGGGAVFHRYPCGRGRGFEAKKKKEKGYIWIGLWAPSSSMINNHQFHRKLEQNVILSVR